MTHSHAAQGSAMKKSRRTTWRTLAVVAILTAAGFLAWIGVLLALWTVLQAAGAAIDFWAMAQTLTSTVAMVCIVVGSVLAFHQLSEAASNRHLAVADRLFEELNSPENIEARRWIFQNLPADPEEGNRTLTPEGHAAVKRVLNSLDHIAFLTQVGWIPEEMIMPWINPMVVKAWDKLEPYVEYESRKRREPDYYQHARKLAGRCLEWRKNHVPNAEIVWLKDAL
jgi:ABC-type multidrug transport system fused ATPase/permease subunit